MFLLGLCANVRTFVGDIRGASLCVGIFVGPASVRIFVGPAYVPHGIAYRRVL